MYRHLLDRTGLLREPAEGRVDFVHRTFQEYLAARSAVIDSDDIGNLVMNAAKDQWREVVVMAVGHASRKQREELLNGLVRRGDASAKDRDKLHLLAVASLETAPEADPDLRRSIEQRADRLLPPKSLESAKSFASAGHYIVERLAATVPTSEVETVATVRALAETGLEEAVEVLSRFGVDDRPAVQQELLRNWSTFEPVSYAAKVLATSPMDSLELRDPALVPGVRHLAKVRRLDEQVPLTTLKDVFPADLRSLSLTVREPVALKDLASLPLEKLCLRREGGVSSSPVIDVAPLGAIESLRTLEFDRVTPENLGSLTASGVRRLKLTRSASPAQLAKIAPGWQLDQLSVSGIVDLQSLQPLSFAVEVKKLVVRGCARIADLGGLEASAQTLRTLLLRDCVTIDLARLPPLTNLTNLDLGASPVFNIGRLASLARLETLTLGRPDDPEALAAVAGLTHLRHLTIRGRGLVDLGVLAGTHGLTISIGASIAVFGQEKLPPDCQVQMQENPGDHARPIRVAKKPCYGDDLTRFRE